MPTIRVYDTNDKFNSHLAQEKFVNFNNVGSVATGGIGSWSPNFSGRITSFYLGVLTAGASDRSVTATVKKNGTTISTTDPAITFNATGPENTYAAATGVTVGVLKTDTTVDFVAGDVFTVELTLGGSAGTAPTGAGVTLGYKEYRLES